jgi:pyrophosphatase PpaX
MTKKYEAVLFDFDGTIMNTNDIILESWQHTFRTVDGAERPFEDIAPTLGEPLRLTMSKFFPGRDPEDMVAIYRSYQQQVYQDRVHLFPGVKSVIQELKERGYRLGLVTSRLRDSTMEGLHKFGIAPYFDAVVTASDTDAHKPDPTPCHMCLDQLGVEPADALYVGDSKFDVLCARNAGVPFVLVGWSICVTDEQKEGIYKPDFHIDHPEDLLQLV